MASALMADAFRHSRLVHAHHDASHEKHETAHPRFACVPFVNYSFHNAKTGYRAYVPNDSDADEKIEMPTHEPEMQVQAVT